MSEEFPDDAIVRAEGAAEALDTSVATFRRRVRVHGGPPSYRRGRHVVFRVGEVRQWWDLVENALIPIEATAPAGSGSGS